MEITSDHCIVNLPANSFVTLPYLPISRMSLWLHQCDHLFCHHHNSNDWLELPVTRFWTLCASKFWINNNSSQERCQWEEASRRVTDGRTMKGLLFLSAGIPARYITRYDGVLCACLQDEFMKLLIPCIPDLTHTLTHVWKTEKGILIEKSGELGER